uniref:Protein sleepless n=1 Tax=Parascaris univalens TaxID=6257 RepID=A0A915BBT5_PARUN
EILFALVFLPIVSSLECYSCGVFLTAPTPNCKGEPIAMNCTNSRTPIGCVYINGENKDGTFYVEKRCGMVDERGLQDGQCIDVIVEKSVKAKKCFCTSDLCNSSPTLTSISLISFVVLIVYFPLT